MILYLKVQYSGSNAWLVPIDLLPDLRISTTLNGEVVQDSNTADMIFSVAEIISFLSTGTTLPTGTVILTGTPEGVSRREREERRSDMKREEEEKSVDIYESVGRSKTMNRNEWCLPKPATV